MRFINPTVFIISLCFGLLISYITLPSSQIIYVYPTPDNMMRVQYKDNADNCYVYAGKETTCPTDSSKIQPYPIQ